MTHKDAVRSAHDSAEQPWTRFWLREQRQIIALVAITLFATALRFYQLGAWSFWGDEWFTITGLEDGFNYNWLRQSLAATWVRAYVEAKGITEANARFIPALIGILTIPPFYLIVRRILTSRIAILAALLLAFSPWHLYWSQNARFYTLLLLFFTLAWACFFLGFEEKRTAYLLLSALFLALAARESLLAVMLIPCVVVFLLWRGVARRDGFSPRWDYRFLLLIPLGVVTLFFAWPYVSNLTSWMEGFGYANSTPFRFSASVAFYIGIPVAVLALAGALHGVLKNRQIIIWLAIVALLPLLLLVILTPFHYVANRYAFIVLTSWIVLAAYALDEIASALGTDTRRRWLLVGLIALPVVHAMADNALYFREQHGNRADWRSGMTLIADQAEPNDRVISTDFKLASHYLGYPTEPVHDSLLDELPNSAAPIWLVVDTTLAEAFPHVEAWFGQNGELVDSFDVHLPGTVYPMRIYVYDPIAGDERALP